MTRRAALTVVTLVAAALVGWPCSRSRARRSTSHRRSVSTSREGSRSRCRPSRRAIGAHEGRPRPLGGDHAGPRRPARRLRARDPDAGRRSDRDPASRCRNPEAAARIIGKTAQLELFDLEANLLAPSINSRPASRSRPRSSTTCSPASRRSRPRESPRRTTSSSKKGRSWSPGPPSHARGGARQVRRARSPPGHKLFAVPPGDRRRLVRTRRARLPRNGGSPGRARLVPDQVRPARSPGDQRSRPRSRWHAPGLRHLAGQLR